MRRYTELAPILALLMGIACVDPSGPPKYGNDVIVITEVVSDRMCEDPAGAKVVFEGTLTLTCTDEDQCGRALGEEHTVPFTLDGRAAQVEATLDNGDPVSLWADCSMFNADFTGTDPVEGPGRDIGGLSPDCTVLFDGKAAADLTDFTLVADWVSEDVRAELTCSGAPPYGVLTPTTLEVGDPACTDGEVLSLGGTGTVTCRSSDRCTEGDVLTFDYALEPAPNTPEITLSSGEMLHLPYSCVDANVALWGEIAGERTVIGSADEACVLTVDADQRAAASNLTVEGDFGWLPEVSFTAACP